MKVFLGKITTEIRGNTPEGIYGEFLITVGISVGTSSELPRGILGEIFARNH